MRTALGFLVLLGGGLFMIFVFMAVMETLGHCGNQFGPGATSSWVGACASHKSLVECRIDAELMGCGP